MQRVFFALWPDEDVAARLHAAAKTAHAACGGRLMRRETLHITLTFLGPLAPARVAVAETAADTVSAQPFALDIDHLGCWKHNQVLWAGSSVPPAALGSLARDLASALLAFGFALDTRPFAVHATLLRKADCTRAVPILEQPIRWPVGEFALVESRLAPDGPRYGVLRRWPLAPG